MTARLFTIASLSSVTTLTWQSLHLQGGWTGWIMAGGASETAGTGLEAAETSAATAGVSVEAAVVAEILGLLGTDHVAAAERGRSEKTGMGVTERGSRGLAKNDQAGKYLKSL